jgi:acyl dehydratase
VRSAEPSQRRPDRGTVTLDSWLTNQHGEVVFRMLGRGLFGRRPAADT